jgi:hypothetical protein
LQGQKRHLLEELAKAKEVYEEKYRQEEKYKLAKIKEQ